jgi:hypothetical protein
MVSAAPLAQGKGGWSQGITLFLVAVCIAAATAAVAWQAWDMFGPSRRPMLQGWDDSFYYVWLPSAVIDHDLDFSKPLAHSATIGAPALDSWLAHPRTATGLLPNKYPPGWALGSLPFFLAAHTVAPAGTTGFEPVYLAAVWLGQLLYAAAGLFLAARIIRRLVPHAPAETVVLAVWLASPLVYYQTARVSLSHSQVFVLAMAAFWLGLRLEDGDDRRRTWIALGFCSALLAVTRNVTVVYLVFPAVMVVRNMRSWRAATLLALGAAGPVAVQLAAWRILFGSWFAYSYDYERFDFAHMHLADVLFSARHGWFYWHPLMLVGTVAFLAWAFRRPIGWPWVASLGAIITLNAAWPTWWFGSSFGNRAFEVATFFAMVGIAALLVAAQGRPAWRRAIAGAMTVAVLWNFALLAMALTRRIPSDVAVTYADAGRALAGWFSGSK